MHWLQEMSVPTDISDVVRCLGHNMTAREGFELTVSYAVEIVDDPQSRLRTKTSEDVIFYNESDKGYFSDIVTCGSTLPLYTLHRHVLTHGTVQGCSKAHFQSKSLQLILPIVFFPTSHVVSLVRPMIASGSTTELQVHRGVLQTRMHRPATSS